MLGKRFRRTTSMLNLGPDCQVVGTPAANTTPEKIQGVNTTAHSVPLKAARPLVLQADVHHVDVNSAADACHVDVNMVPGCDSATQTQRPCQMNEGSCAVDVVCGDANMEAMVQGCEHKSSSIECYGEASCIKAGLDCSDNMLEGMMQVQYGGMIPCFEEHSLMAYQMGLWTNNNMHLRHGQVKQEQLISPVDFLDVCFYCKRRLRHERDIFIYRGDTAFCSEECRHRQIVNDERRSTRSTSKKRGSARANSSSETAVAA